MAIDDLLDEHEQSERVRTWLRGNSIGLIGGVALGLAAIYGWNWWSDQAMAKKMQASDAYEAMLKQAREGNLKEAQAAAGGLKDEAYSVLAALDLAKAQVDGGQRDAAIATLKSVKGRDSMLAPVIDQCLARLLIIAGQREDALKLVAETADDAAAQEIRGDAFYALGKMDQARSAYSKALSKLDVAARQRRMVELKLSQAGGTPSKPKTAS
ncbi:MAG: tetratricopeptide repeat protein [Lysobacteraceae bacterium]|nr:MAG: tetratricopeptide repeat protein [Xanthomonadaceae bacterium]